MIDGKKAARAVRRYWPFVGLPAAGFGIAGLAVNGYLPAPFVLVGIGLAAGGYFVALLVEAGGFNDD